MANARLKWVVMTEVQIVQNFKPCVPINVSLESAEAYVRAWNEKQYDQDEVNKSGYRVHTIWQDSWIGKNYKYLVLTKVEPDRNEYGECAP